MEPHNEQCLRQQYGKSGVEDVTVKKEYEVGARKTFVVKKKIDFLHDGVDFEKKVHSITSNIPQSRHIVPLKMESNTITANERTNQSKTFIRPYFYKSLAELMLNKLSPELRMFVSYQILQAVDEIHSKNLYHGDLNPNNIFLTSNNWVIITDFGCWKPEYIRSQDNHRFIFTTYFCSSELKEPTCYLAPEKFVTNETPTVKLIDMQSMDLFSVGCILFKLFLGQSLFTFESLLNFNQVRVDNMVRELPVTIQKLVALLLSRQPNNRLEIRDYLNPLHPDLNHFYEYYVVREIHGFVYKYFLSLRQQSFENQVIQLYTDFLSIPRGGDHESPIFNGYKDFYAGMLPQMLRGIPELLKNTPYFLSINNICTVIFKNRSIDELREKAKDQRSAVKKAIDDYRNNKVDTFKFKTLREYVRTIPGFTHFQFSITLSICFDIMNFLAGIRSQGGDVSLIGIQYVTLFLQIKLTQLASQVRSVPIVDTGDRRFVDILLEHGDKYNTSFIVSAVKSPYIDIHYIEELLRNKLKKNFKNDRILKKEFTVYSQLICDLESSNFSRHIPPIPSCYSLFVPTLTQALTSGLSDQTQFFVVQLLEFIITKLEERLNLRDSIVEILESLSILRRSPNTFEGALNLTLEVLPTKGQLTVHDATIIAKELPRIIESFKWHIEKPPENILPDLPLSLYRKMAEMFSSLIQKISQTNIADSLATSFCVDSVAANGDSKTILISRFKEQIENILGMPKVYKEFIIGLVPSFHYLILDMFSTNQDIQVQLFHILTSLTYSIINDSTKPKSETNHPQTYYTETLLLLLNQFGTLRTHFHAVSNGHNYQSAKKWVEPLVEIFLEYCLVFFYSILSTPPQSQYLYSLIINKFLDFYSDFFPSHQNPPIYGRQQFRQVRQIITYQKILDKIFSSIFKLLKTCTSTTQSRIHSSLINSVITFITKYQQSEQYVTRKLIRNHFRPRDRVTDVSEPQLRHFFTHFRFDAASATSDDDSITVTISSPHQISSSLQPQTEVQPEPTPPPTANPSSSYMNWSFLSGWWGSKSNLQTSTTSSTSSSTSSSQSSTSGSNSNIFGSTNNNNNNNNNNSTASPYSSSSSTGGSNSNIPKLSPSQPRTSIINAPVGSSEFKSSFSAQSNFSSSGSSNNNHKYSGSIGHCNQPNFNIHVSSFEKIYPVRSSFHIFGNFQSVYPSEKDGTIVHCADPSKETLPSQDSLSTIQSTLSTELSQSLRPTCRKYFSRISLENEVPNIKTYAPKLISYNGSVPRGRSFNLSVAHSAKVNDLEVSSNNRFFFSCSDDNTAKIWDSDMFFRDQRSRFVPRVITNKIENDQIKAISYINSTESLALLSARGHLFVHAINGSLGYSYEFSNGNGVETFQFLKSFFKYHDSDYFDPSLFVCGTNFGRIVLHDIRTSKPTILQSEPFSVITSMMVDCSRNMIITGNTEGLCKCWDIRYQLPFHTWELPVSNTSLHRAVSNITNLHSPNSDSFHVVATIQNEMFLWDLASSNCLGVWRTLDSRPDSNSGQVGLNSSGRFTALQNIGSSVVTGGIDSTLRFWDLNEVTKSFIFSSPRDDVPQYTSIQLPGYSVYSEYPQTPLAARSYLPERNHGYHSGYISSLQFVNYDFASSKGGIVAGSSTGEISFWSCTPYNS